MTVSANRGAVRLGLLGVATLLLPGGEAVKLERRTAGLLAYLALEGSTARSRLAGLLWPGTLQATARNNLAQALRRLRTGCGHNLVLGTDTLSLNADPSVGLTVDAAALELAWFTDDDERLLAFPGDLLEGFDFDDCAEFQEWLSLRREHLLRLRLEAHERCGRRAEQSGAFRLALEHAARALTLDPLSEAAHRQVMRLHYGNGDRGAALQAFERCQRTLERELGVPPLPETLGLAETIARGLTVAAPSPSANRIPVAMLRPPSLVGREREWAQLERARDGGLITLVSAEAGMGKTRLVTDFLARHGQPLRFEGRPGDALVSYSSNARVFRQLLRTLPLKLPDWARLELSRILPELGSPPGAIQNEAEKLRFFAAQAEALRLAMRAGLSHVFFDDLHFMDEASFEASFQTWNELAPSGLQLLLAYRSAELGAVARQRLQELIVSGRAAAVELEALSEPAVRTLLQETAVAGLERYGESIYRATGGNPMFVLETARSLFSGGKPEEAPTREVPLPAVIDVPLPATVEAVIRSRLERLSGAGLRLARIASVAGTDFSLALAARLLNVDALDLTEAIQELERQQVMQGEAFTHDLISQATLAALPVGVRKLLHANIAVALEVAQPEAPARIADHWIAAGEERKAVPYLEKAAVATRARYQLRESVQLGTQAARILERHDEPDRAWHCWAQVRDVMRQLEVGDELEAVIEALQRTARSVQQRADALNAECDMWLKRGRAPRAKRAALRLSVLSAETQDLYTLQLAENNLGIVCWLQGQSLEAANHFSLSITYGRSLLERQVQCGPSEPEQRRFERMLAESQTNHAVILDNLGRYDEAETNHRAAIETYRRWHDVLALNQVLSNYSVNLSDQGRVREALRCLQEAHGLANALSEDTIDAITQHCNISGAHLMLNDFSRALEHALRMQAIAERKGHHILNVLTRLGAVYRVLGAVDRAEAVFARGGELPSDVPIFQHSWLRNHAIHLLEQGKPDHDLAARAMGLLKKKEHVFRWYRTHLELLPYLPLRKRWRIVEDALNDPASQGMQGLRILALTRGAQVSLELGRSARALECSAQAVALLADFEPELQRAEVLLTHQRSLEANRDSRANEHLERTLAWLLEVADHRVPDGFRDSFLRGNPYNAAILERARNAGLEVP